ncbi:MAG: glycosyltransferase family 2 protein [Alphaproteobacteria bacterium]|nr:glycosyltransferase family 2 protein [Alphaproteobacteria bacterium]HPF46435.1 glycosyltransferase family 2 protein [Emcibacteraceae bacterium]
MSKDRKLSVIVPCYNEEEVIETCYSRIADVFKDIDYTLELIFINDGSADKTAELIHKICENDKRVVFIDLSRNFGKEAAMSAGIDMMSGDAAIILDADLQDPPEIIPQFIALWEQGYDNIYGVRTERDGESWFKKMTATYFYRILKRMSFVDIPRNAGDFRLLSRRAIDAIRKLPERQRFMKGLFAWIGFNTIAVKYKRQARVAGSTKWNYWNLWNFAIEGITSFSTLPLRLASYIGILISFLSFIYAVFIFIRTLIYGVGVDGYASQMVVILFLGGLQLLFLGIMGEYLGRVFNETKDRPLYMTKNIINLPDD